MPKYIIKVKDCYMEWSSICDAPTTYGMSLEEFKEYYQEEYGLSGMKELPERLQRVEEKGCSAYMEMSAEDLVVGNRAGEGESTLTFDEIYQKYYLERPEE